MRGQAQLLSWCSSSTAGPLRQQSPFPAVAPARAPTTLWTLARPPTASASAATEVQLAEAPTLPPRPLPAPSTVPQPAAAKRDASHASSSGSAGILPMGEAGTGRAALAEQGQVPRTMRQAVAVYLSHPTPQLILAGIAALTAWRAQYPLHSSDIAVAAVVAGWWLIQEWLVHAKLLHSTFDWLGRDIHHGHHMKPYFHVSIDGLLVVAPAMVASFALFYGLSGGSPLGLTATISYYVMGLSYQWTHFLVHTKVVPTSAVGRHIRRHHMLHHCRNEAYWLSFMLPAVDKLFDTAPEPGSVTMSQLAKISK